MSSISVDVDVDLYDFDDDDLVDELEGRGYIVTKAKGSTFSADSLERLATELLVALTNKDSATTERCAKQFVEIVLDKRV
jgi:hypothetical protein